MSKHPQTPQNFVKHIAIVTSAIAGKPLEDSLEAELNSQFPVGGDWFTVATSLCHQGITEGWLCEREAGGIKYGRPVHAGDETHRFSVDVVEMESLAGPHHTHTNGEIDLIMPIDETAEFDGKGAGWMVYPPKTSHSPTVSGGKAIILYLLPEGAIDFTVQ
jgi:hypothetical protein|tara:strand:+ start:86011 stop:86493 length:483 start_codon:yes stop_codon:yes gene_type:complete